jgi:hypothetical protein
MAIAYPVLFCCPDFLGAAKSCALSKIKGGDNTGSIHPMICGSPHPRPNFNELASFCPVDVDQSPEGGAVVG